MQEALAKGEEKEAVQLGLMLCDTLYARFAARYGAPPSGDPWRRAEILRALREGDAGWLNTALDNAEPGSWDFVYPPASRKLDGSRDELTEGWARSPLAILVRPLGGFLGSRFMPGVSTRERLRLIGKALSSGVASPGFADGYWGCPAIQAALGCDVDSLNLLHGAGLDLRTVKVDWLLHGSRTFTVAHAAAFNGYPEVLSWLREKYFAVHATQAELSFFFSRPNGLGSTPLDVALQTSRNEECAHLLLDYGADAFRLHPLTGASPMSTALERHPALAERMLRERTMRYSMWFGNTLVQSDFSGIAVPAQGPIALQFTLDNDDAGARELRSFEELVLATQRVSLADVPVVRSLVEAKWAGFAADSYLWTLGEYILLYTLTFAGAVGQFTELRQMILPFETYILAGCLAAWVQYAQKQVRELQTSGWKSYFRQASSRIDLAVCVCLPITVCAHLFSVMQGTTLPPAVAGVDAVLQIAMSWRLLLYISAFESNSFGPFLVVVTTLLSALVEPLGFLLLTLLTFANAFTIIFNYGSSQDPRPYGEIFWKEARLVLKGGDSVDEGSVLFVGLPLEALGDVLLAVFVAVVVLGTVGLFQATVDRTVKAASEDMAAQFRWLRLQLIASTERQLQADETGRAVLKSFYEDLSQLKGRPQIRGGKARLIYPSDRRRGSNSQRPAA